MERIFNECLSHRDSKPTAAHGVTVRRDGKWVEVGVLVICPPCNDWQPGRRVFTMKNRSASEVCGPKCLSGGKTCSCRCRGKCHGTGRCEC